MKFNTLQIKQEILRAIDEQGYENMTPIQEKAIPVALEGKDILGCAQTGTGKTAAFSIPTIQSLGQHNRTKIRALILTPTRELALQILENINAYAKYTTIKSAVLFGGVPQKPQEKILRSGVDILVATPGRLLDLMKQNIIDIGQIEIFILDEADRMLDMGFMMDVKKIIAKLPNKKQTLLFSATMPKDIRAFAHTLLNNPVTIEVNPASTTVDTIQQTLYYVDKPNKKKLLVDIMKKDKIENALVFTRTKANANRLAKYLIAEKIDTVVIHGNKSQNARQIALANFKDGKSKILVATDIAARGIDINELSHVFNYEIPNEPESYVHRIGRTGRAGKDGISISFCDIDEMPYIKSIQKLIGFEIPVNRDHDYPLMNTTATPKKQTNHARPKRAAQTNPSKENNHAKPKNPKGALASNASKETGYKKSKYAGHHTKANGAKPKHSNHSSNAKRQSNAKSSGSSYKKGNHQ